MARAVPVIVGWLVLAVAVDLGAGTLLERVHPQDVPGRPPLAPAATADIEVATTSPAMPPTCLGHATLTPENRIHATEGPVADLPWNEEFWCEFGRLRQEYVPFLLARTADTRQRLINVRGGVRRSYQPPGADDGAPVIWFFGGRPCGGGASATATPSPPRWRG